MDKKVTNNLIVGIFVFIGFFGFVFVIFNIGSGSGLLTRQFTLYARYDKVKGLHYGSEVALNGLRAGTVKSIKVDSETNSGMIVELNINKEMADKIREDSTATIQTQGVLGDKFIEISLGSPNLPQLKEKSFIQTSQLPDLFTKSGNVIEEISKQFQKGGDVGILLKNLVAVTGNLAQITGDIKTHNGLLREAIYGTSGKSLNQSMKSLDDILRKINSGEGTIGALINDPTVYEDIKYLMGGAKRSSVLKYFMRSFIESGEKGEKEKQEEKKK